MIEIVEEDAPAGATIKVIGVGGGGGNAINTMIASGLSGVEFIAMNTDAQDPPPLGWHPVASSSAPSSPRVSARAPTLRSAVKQPSKIATASLSSSSAPTWCSVTAGMGGGTGSPAPQPVIAQVARECGALTVGVVTRPFTFEGKRRRRQAQEGIEALSANVDTLITIPNQRLINMSNERTSMKDAFRVADEVLPLRREGCRRPHQLPRRGQRRLCRRPHHDEWEGGRAHGRGPCGRRAQGRGGCPSRDQLAAARRRVHGWRHERAYQHHGLRCPQPLRGARSAHAHPGRSHEDAQVIFGWVIDETLKDEVRVTVIATGFEEARQAIPLSSVERRVNERVFPASGQRRSWPRTRAPQRHRSHARRLRHPDVLPQRRLIASASKRGVLAGRAGAPRLSLGWPKGAGAPLCGRSPVPARSCGSVGPPTANGRWASCRRLRLP